MQKRGQHGNIELWFLLAAFLIAAVAGLDLIQNTKNTLEGNLLEKNYIARDLALTLDAIYASPGNVIYTYSLADRLQKNDFRIEIRDNKVFVKDSAGAVSYSVVGSSFIDTDYESPQNPEGFKVHMPGTKMVGKVIDRTKPVDLQLSKEILEEGNSVIRITSDNFKFCMLGKDGNCL